MTADDDEFLNNGRYNITTFILCFANDDLEETVPYYWDYNLHSFTCSHFNLQCTDCTHEPSLHETKKLKLEVTGVTNFIKIVRLMRLS